METSKITSKGQIVIPKKYRKKFGLQTGDQIALIEANGDIVIRPIDRSYFERFAGILSGKENILKALMDEKKKERER